MKFPSFENAKWYALVGCLAAALALLAVLQYQSSKQVRKATAEQMLTHLEGSVANMREGLDSELTPLCRELQQRETESREPSLPDYARGFERWRKAAAHPGLVSTVYVWEPADKQSDHLFRLDFQSNEFEPTDWPANLAQLRQKLQGLTSIFDSPGAYAPDQKGSKNPNSRPDDMPPPRPGPSSRSGPGGRGDAPPQDFGPPFGFDHPNDPDRPRGPSQYPVPPPPPGASNRHSPNGSSSLGWMIDESVSVLVHAVLARDQRGPRTSGNRRSHVTWILVPLDLGILRSHIFPELVQRYFGSADLSPYEIAVVQENESDRVVIYSSDPAFSLPIGMVPDAAVNLFGRPVAIVGGGQIPIQVGFPPGSRPPGSTTGERVGSSEPPKQEPFKIEPIRYHPEDRGWELIAKHRKGSVEAAVASLYHRNLAFNFCVLLVLAATMAMIGLNSRRARRLAQLQMDFVASVSHELRTPLTGIVSAAQNIADGIVEDKERVARYGTAILSQAQQLTELVEHILLFSAAEKDRHRYHLQPVSVEKLIDSALSSAASLIRSSGVTVERQVQANLPCVRVDFNAFSQCLLNLVVNAVKYGGERRWLGITASEGESPEHGREIAIAVEDRGIGIEKNNLKRIFEPFYRTPVATAAQIHGTGLGLPLAKSIAEAMGGRLTVNSAPQKGSTFTVHLPLASQRAAENLM